MNKPLNHIKIKSIHEAGGNVYAIGHNGYLYLVQFQTLIPIGLKDEVLTGNDTLLDQPTGAGCFGSIDPASYVSLGGIDQSERRETDRRVSAVMEGVMEGVKSPRDILAEMTDVQCSDGNWNYDRYMHGMANGMIFALSLIDGMDPEFMDPPSKWFSGFEKSRPDTD